MNKVFNKFSYEVEDYLNDYTFIGRITINKSLEQNSIDGTIIFKQQKLDNIFIRVDINNNIISVSTSNIEVQNTPKEIVNQFIDRLIAEANRQYSAYITALNS